MAGNWEYRTKGRAVVADGERRYASIREASAAEGPSTNSIRTCCLCKYRGECEMCGLFRRFKKTFRFAEEKEKTDGES